MRTTIRLDDISIDMDMKKFNRIRSILDKAGIAPLIGVIPCPKLNRKVSEEWHLEYMGLLHELIFSGWVVAMHGCYHEYVTDNGGIFPLNDFSEFAGLPYEEQLQKIKTGKKALEALGINPEIFMAPAHTYDENTLKALRKCGFKKVTDGFGSKPYIYQGLTFYPIAKKRSDIHSLNPGYTTLVLHPAMMSDAEMDEFQELINNNRECFVNYGDYLKVTPFKRTQLDSFVERTQAKAKFKLVKMRSKAKGGNHD